MGIYLHIFVHAILLGRLSPVLILHAYLTCCLLGFVFSIVRLKRIFSTLCSLVCVCVCVCVCLCVCVYAHTREVASIMSDSV